VSSLLNFISDTVDDCHPAPPLCLAPTTTVAEALRQMKEHNRGMVLVCDAQAIVGIFTERDALRMMAAGSRFDVPIERCMTARPLVLRSGDAVAKAISMMSKGGYRRLPIVDEQGRPKGIVTAEGIMRYLAEHIPTVIYNLPPEPHHATQEREGA